MLQLRREIERLRADIKNREKKVSRETARSANSGSGVTSGRREALVTNPLTSGKTESRPAGGHSLAPRESREGLPRTPLKETSRERPAFGPAQPGPGRDDGAGTNADLAPATGQTAELPDLPVTHMVIPRRLGGPAGPKGHPLQSSGMAFEFGPREDAPFAPPSAPVEAMHETMFPPTLRNYTGDYLAKLRQSQ